MKRIGWVLIGIIAVLSVFFWLYLFDPFCYKDIGTEEIDVALTAGYLDKAKSSGIRSDVYLKTAEELTDIRMENTGKAFAYPNNEFQFRYISGIAADVVSIAPFIHWLGVSSESVAICSLSYLFLSLLALYYMATKSIGKWHGLLSVALMLSSLSLLIHVRVGMAFWMPCVLLFIVMGYFAWKYMKTGKYRYISMASIPVAIMYWTAWFSFAMSSLFILFIIVFDRSIKEKIIATLVVFVSVVSTWFIFGYSYSLFYGLSFLENNQIVVSAMLGRYSQGAVPFLNHNVWGKIATMFRCLFVDMTFVEHFDKFLENAPAIPAIFSLFFVVGLVRSLIVRSIIHKILLLWILSGVVLFTTLSLFANRYALMLLPAMAIMAADGIIWISSLSKKTEYAFTFVVVLSLFFSLIETHRLYYTDYLTKRPPVFDIQSQKGWHDFGEWIQKKYPPDTLIVFSDPIIFSHSFLKFHAWSSPYRFTYWSKWFGEESDPLAVNKWENDVLTRYRKILYVMSCLEMRHFQSYKDMDVTSNFDLFFGTHKNINPVWVGGSHVFPFFAFEVSKEEVQ